jgi:hypothetical protein
MCSPLYSMKHSIFLNQLQNKGISHFKVLLQVPVKMYRGSLQSLKISELKVKTELQVKWVGSYR